MAEILKPDICVIGGGSGGLSVAAAAAAFGVPVVLIEKAQDGRRLPQHRLRAVEGAAGGGQARRAGAQRARLRRRRRERRGRLRQGARSRAERDRRDRAERFGRALHRPRRARDRGLRRDSTTAARSRSATIRDPRAPFRDRHRLDAGAAADPGPRRRAYLTNENIFDLDRAAASISSSSAPARSGSNWRRASAGSAAT